MPIKSIDVMNLVNLFNKKQKIIFGTFIILSFFLVALEILGIYMLIPLMQTLTEESFNPIKIKFFYYEFFESQIFNLIFIIFIIYTFKNFYAILLEYYKFKFSYDLKIKLTKKLFKNYINKSILFHLNNNSSKLIRNIHDIHTIINLTKNMMLLITEFLIVLGLSFFLLFFETQVAISAILFLGIISTIFYKSIQKRVAYAGKIKQKNDALRIMHLLQGFRGIKDIKIFNKENFFTKKFSHHDSLSSFADFSHNFLLSLPKLIIEWLLILTVVLFIGIVVFEGKNYSYLITTLGVFLAAALRLMPSVTRLLNAVQSINFFRSVVKTIKNEILSSNDENKKNVIENNSLPLSFQNSIKIQDLSFKYDNKEKLILKNLDLEIKKKEKIGVFGESGSGKTTLINILLGLIKPINGDVKIDGQSIFENLNNWYPKIGYVSQFTYLSDDSIQKNIAFGLDEKDIEKAKLDICINNAGLKKFIDNLDSGVETRVGELGDKISGGERQRIGIARSLYLNPSILILDEFTSALDNETETLILNQIFDNTKDITIFLVSHRESTLKRCDRIFELKNQNLTKI